MARQGWAGRGKVWRGKARLGPARRGRARQGGGKRREKCLEKIIGLKKEKKTGKNATATTIADHAEADFISLAF